jgi:4'-phosphopantetheinyl transferase
MRRLALPETVPYGIEVWLLTLNLHMPLSHRDLALLNDEERLQTLRFSRHEDRVRSVKTRAALRRLLSWRIGVAPDELRLVVNPYGKPSLFGDSGIEFNVSHSGRFALIALSTTGQVGVDIECCDREVDTEGLIEFVFSPLEHRSGMQTTKAFFERWVAKESVLKALGLGISEYLQAVSVLPGKGDAYVVAHERPDWARIKAWSIRVPRNYVAAVAWKSRATEKRGGRWGNRSALTITAGLSHLQTLGRGRGAE